MSESERGGRGEGERATCSHPMYVNIISSCSVNTQGQERMIGTNEKGGYLSIDHTLLSGTSL